MFNSLKKVLVCVLLSSTLLGCTEEPPFSFSKEKVLFDVVSCRDDDKGTSCTSFLKEGIEGSFLFQVALKRVYLEVDVLQVRRTYPQRVVAIRRKVLVEHGTLRKKIKDIPQGYDLISCFCSQPECIMLSPNKEQIISSDLLIKKRRTLTIAK